MTFTPVSITVDNTGAYNKFLTALETNIGKAKVGDVRFVLHSDEDKQVYIPRKGYNKMRFNLYINNTNVDELSDGCHEVHQSMAMLLAERVKTSGYYVIWENAERIFLVPAPTGQKKQRVTTRGFGG